MLDFIAGDVISVRPFHARRPDVLELRIRAGRDHHCPGIQLPFVWDHGPLPARPNQHVVLMLKGSRVLGLHNVSTDQQVNCMSRVSPRLLVPADVLHSFAIYLVVVLLLGVVHAVAAAMAWGIVAIASRQLTHRWLRREVEVALSDLR
jgi:hypothetical protein